MGMQMVNEKKNKTILYHLLNRRLVLAARIVSVNNPNEEKTKIRTKSIIYILFFGNFKSLSDEILCFFCAVHR